MSERPKPSVPITWKEPPTHGRMRSGIAAMLSLTATVTGTLPSSCSLANWSAAPRWDAVCSMLPLPLPHGAVHRRTWPTKLRTPPSSRSRAAAASAAARWSRIEQADQRSLVGFDAVQAAEDGLVGVLRLGGHHEILVVRGDVVDDVLVFAVHLLHAALDDGRHLVGVGRVVGHAAGLVMAMSKECPSWCWRPSPLSVVRPRLHR